MKSRLIVATIGALGVAAGLTALAPAQTDLLMQAFENGQVGVTSTGEYGIVGSASSELRQQVDAANIARRAEYARLAQQSGATRNVVARQAACQWISRLQPGRRYQQGDGSWATVTSTPPPPPSYC